MPKLGKIGPQQPEGPERPVYGHRPAPSKKVSQELKTNLNDTAAVARKAILAYGKAEIENPTKGALNSKDKVIGKLARRHMFAQRI